MENRVWLLKPWLPVHPSQTEIQRQSFKETEKSGFSIFPGKRETQKASASRIVPSTLKNRERFLYSHEGPAFFFFFAKFQNATVSIRQLSNCDWCP